MRTKTLALSAVLGMLGSASLVAQNNVYSINAVGYINVTMPPGYSIVTCPLLCGTDPGTQPNSIAGLQNDLNVLFPQTGDAYDGAQVSSYSNGHGFVAQDTAYTGSGSWASGGTIQLMPGAAVFFNNQTANSMTATFVGTVPQGTLANTLQNGYNLVGSMVPTSGDFTANAILNGGSADGFSGPTSGDQVFFYTPGVGYVGANDGDCIFYGAQSWAGGSGTGDSSNPPADSSVTQGFFYYNFGSTRNWTETFTINP